jgi:cell division protein FtsQ
MTYCQVLFTFINTSLCIQDFPVCSRGAQVEIHERTPLAFARVGQRMFLIDAGGTLMELMPKHKYSFPVILRMNPGEPLSTRSPRMKTYREMVQDIDSGGRVIRRT